MSTLPTISPGELESVMDEPADLISMLASKYRELIATDSAGQIQNSFNTQQSVLMAFEVFDGQVNAGGFIQLIENGFGAYIFDTSFSTTIKGWGLDKSALLIDQARVLYAAKKETLEREKSLQEFAKLYQEHPEFDTLDAEFYAIIDSERNILKEYIMKNIVKFALIA